MSAADLERGPLPVSKVDYVVARLRSEIESGEVEAGDPLRQLEIAERYGVSATPVREALRLLAAEGAVAYVQHRGVSVAQMSSTSLHDLYRLRSLAEGLAVELAVTRMQPDRLVAIREAHSVLAQSKGQGEPETLAALNRAFHFSIYDTGSDLITRHLRQIWTALPPKQTIWSPRENAEILLLEHARIMDAIEVGDAVRAGELMAAHVQTAGRLRMDGIAASHPDEPEAGQRR